VRGLYGVDPAAAVGVHATGATDKLLTLSAYGLFDRAAYAAAPRSLHHAIFVKGAARAAPPRACARALWPRWSVVVPSLSGLRTESLTG
jgi:hypothetical protein